MTKAKKKNTSAETITHSVKETIALAKSFAAQLKPGTVIALEGNLGAGKTAFIKGIALGLGLKDPDEVKSPTFAIMHTYKTRPALYHFDLYRLESEKEIANIGFDEFLSDPSAIVCIEWPSRAKGFLPKSSVSIKLTVEGPSERKISILSKGL